MKKKGRALAAALLGSLLALTGCGGAGGGSAASAAAGEYHKISPREAKERMEAGGATVVDVRTAEEYGESHIPGAVLVPLDTIGSQRPAALPDTGAELLVYCRSGVRSRAAAEQLAALGYQQVYDFGGIIDWPYETVRGEE
ncbi:rhodanese-like domain-containing protein [Acetanaerobacterium sp. MSJ-12]|uniref:Rhodanese-like domain-containing protein n=1 Tax=Bittarella massiliensis (ex Durand et al. 2017) TaxID=1720313 RepID=A0AAW5KD59_9FIRM|nr:MULTISPECIES: rhodanese-like domain-containing protein [Oscillospiraceae]MBU5419844.1 rhodanese-like domain-containing protein [Acetanaerobacterium sp. MSJ-12]MCQ4949276.1 rhodanese-like domain-containing protein [Bittarella massiliensis (ex Durand et al. 2017)]